MVYWCYENRSSEIDQWTPYCRIETEIIEDAFQSKQEKVELDRFFIDLRLYIQIDKSDESKQTNIQRSTVIQRTRTRRLRADRFGLTEPLRNRTFANNDNQGNFRGFAWEWFENRAQANQLTLTEILAQAAQGILVEGNLCGESIKVKKMSEKLLDIRDEDKHLITQYCLQFYTADTFLYKLVNTTLRDSDRTKFDTLGPYCYLLKYIALLNLYPTHVYEQIVYRGAQLDEEDIDQYRNAVNDPQLKQWLAFTSTTKNLEVAECFRGNTLFVIQLPINRYSFGMDISSYSIFSDEEEVLLPMQICFKVENVEFNDEKSQTVIYLNMDLVP